jgi:NitT/TauT family transport system substrate-binding protein
MKKLIALFLTLALSTLAFVSCAPDKAGQQKISVAYLAGPTGMGMAKLIKDTPADSEKYAFTAFTDPNTAASELLSGKVDMACLPTNAAANLFNKGKDISVIAVNTLGSLYLITDKNTSIESIKDLEGKTIYTSVPGSTTEPILKHILEKNQVNATIDTTAKDHDVLVEKVVTSEGEMIAVLPEPKVSATILQAKTQGKEFSVKLNLSKEWEKVSDQPLAMGCIVVRNDFLKANKAAVNEFLKDYKTSVDFIAATENLEAAAQTIVDTGIIPKPPLAKSALKNLNGSIVLITGQEMKDTLVAFYGVLLKSSSATVGGKQPDTAFYYDK